LIAIEQAKNDFTNLASEEQIEKYVADLQVEMTGLINTNPQIPGGKTSRVSAEKPICGYGFGRSENSTI